MYVYWIVQMQLRSADRLPELAELFKDKIIPLAERGGAAPGSTRLFRPTTATGPEASLTVSSTTEFENAEAWAAWFEKVNQLPELAEVTLQLVGPDGPAVTVGRNLVSEVAM